MTEFSLRDSDAIDLRCGLDIRTFQMTQDDSTMQPRVTTAALTPGVTSVAPPCPCFLPMAWNSFDIAQRLSLHSKDKWRKMQSTNRREMAESLSHTLYQSPVRFFSAFLVGKG